MWLDVAVCVFLVLFHVCQDKEKKTSFDGSIINLDTRANMATDMVKVVIQQKVSPVEVVYKVRLKFVRARG